MVLGSDAGERRLQSIELMSRDTNAAMYNALLLMRLVTSMATTTVAATAVTFSIVY